jgi:hypothetical protein
MTSSVSSDKSNVYFELYVFVCIVHTCMYLCKLDFIFTLVVYGIIIILYYYHFLLLLLHLKFNNFNLIVYYFYLNIY